MALDPSISLQVRPPAIPQVEIQTPLEQYGKILSLRGLMQQGQLRDLQLREAQQEMQDTENLRSWIQTHPQATATDVVMANPTKPGLAFGKSMSDFNEAKLKQDAATVDYHQKQTKEAASIMQGIVDDTTKNDKLGELLAKKYITPEEYQRYINIPFKDPTFQNVYNSRLNQALETDKLLTETRNKINDQLTNSPKQRIEDAIDLAAAAEQGGDKLNNALAAIRAVSPKRAAVFEGLTTGKDIMQKALTPEQFVSSAETARHNQAVEDYTKQGHDATTANQKANQEASLRQDYLTTSKPFQAVTDAYGRIKQASKDPASGASDIALLYGYMKILDPNSAVREGEFATAQNAGGIPDKIRAMWNGLLNGERLSSDVRTSIVGQAENLYGQAVSDHRKTVKQYSDIATRQNIDPRNVVLDFESTIGGQNAAVPYKTGDRVTSGGKTHVYIGPGKPDDWKDSNNWTEFKPLQ